MPFASLNAICFSRLRAVSSMVAAMLSVTLSAYMMTRPLTFLAARPAVWVKLRLLRKKPSLSASMMATRLTSGRSSPSRKRFTPTRTSNAPSRSSRRISTRSRVLTSEWMYRVLMLSRSRYFVSSSAMRLVRVVTNTRSSLAMVFRISTTRSSTWLSHGFTSMGGSRRPVGRITCSTMTPSARSNS